MKMKLWAILPTAVLALCSSTATHAQLLKYTSKDSINGKPTFETSLSGRLKFNGLYDIRGNLYENSSFLIHNNDLNAPDRPGLWMDMRQSQIRLDGTRRLSNGHEIFSRIEADFEGGAAGQSSFRIRHAYIQYRNFTVGQTWSAFGDGDMWPAGLLDWGGLTGMVRSRRPQLRYSFNPATRLTAEVSAEIMETRRLYDYNVSANPEEVHYVPRKMPDFVGTLKYDLKPGFIKVAGLYRNIGYGYAEQYKAAHGYGVSMMANLYVGDNKKDNFQIQYNIGRGFADYLLAAGGAKLDGHVSLENEQELNLLPLHTGYASYQHFWTKKVHSTALFSYNHFDGTESLYEWKSQTNLMAGGNTLVDVLPNLTVGAEFLWGRNYMEYETGTEYGLASRINFGFLYNF